MTEPPIYLHLTCLTLCACASAIASVYMLTLGFTAAGVCSLLATAVYLHALVLETFYLFRLGLNLEA